MKVIFNKKFLEDIGLFGNTVTISNYSLGKYYREVTDLEELTKSTYLEGDNKKTSNYQIESIWNEENNLLKLNLTFFSDVIKNKVIENKYEFIYIFYKNMLGLENIAFILTGDIVLSNSFQIDEIGLSISKNLIELNIPNVKATINTVMSEDTKFLEGIGINYGYNIFKVSDDTNQVEKDKILVSKESYYRYILNKKCSGFSFDIPYLNIFGEKVIDKGESFISITRLKIWTKNISFDDIIPTDRTLDINGGSIDLLGEFDYSIYKSNQNGVLEKVESFSKVDIGYLGSYKFEIVNDEGLKIEFDSTTRKISFGKNSNPNNNLSTTIKISCNSYNPKTKKIEIIDSNEIKLIQGQAESEWQVIKNTPYSEENIPLYVLDESINSSKSFFIKTNIDFSEIPINIVPENELAETFFSFTSQKDIQSGTITISIETKEDNVKSGIWNPSKTVQLEGEESEIVSELVLINVIVKDRKTSFYCIQKYPVEGMYIYEGVTGYKYRKIDYIYLPRNTKSKTVYLGKITGNVENFDYWKYLENPENQNITLSKTNDELNNEDPNTWYDISDPEKNLPKYLVVSTTETYDTIGDTELGEITFQRVRKDQIEDNITYWKDAISVGSLSVKVILQGQEPSLTIYNDQILTEGLGVYKFYVKSNCPFIGSIKNNLPEVNYDFYESWGNNYDNSSGIPVYIKMTKASYDYQSDKIEAAEITISSSNTYPIISKTLKVVINPISADLRKIDPVDSEDKVFVGSSDKIRFFTKKSMNFNTEGNIKNYISSTRFTDSFSKNSETLNYSEFNFSLGNSFEKYPITKLGDLMLNSEGNLIETLTYHIYKRGSSPSINMSSGYSNDVYLESPNESYKDVQIKTKYDIVESEIKKSNYSGGDFSFIITKGSEDNYGYITYSIRFRAAQENSSNYTKSLGNIKITSRIPSEQFIVGETFSQDFVDSIAGTDYLYIYVYQRGSGITDPEISGDTSYVKASGEIRNYSINSGDTILNSVSISENNNLISTSYNSGLKRITATIQDRLNTSSDKTYSPISVKNYEEYLKFSKDLNTGFSAYIRGDGSNSWNKSINLIQLGYKYGIVFKSKEIENTLFLSTSEVNKVTLNVTPESNEVDIGLGLFSISSQINKGQNGINVVITSELQENSYEKINDLPIFDTYNIKLKYQKNINATRKLFKYYASINDSNMESHELIIQIIQGGNSYKLNTDNIPNNGLVLFHSSGHCFQNFPDLDIVDNIETDIPLENIKVWSTISDLTYNITPIGNGVSFPKYKISASIKPNQGYDIVNGDLYYGYEDLGGKITLWTGKIKQGFLDVQITTPNENLIRNNETTEIIDSPGKITGTEESDRVIFPIKVIQREVNSDGELKDEILIDKNNFGLKGNDRDWTASGYNVDNVFSSYESKYIINDNKIPAEKIPFIEHQYIVKQGFYTTEVLLTIKTIIYVNYPDIEEISPDYKFTFRLNKVKDENPILDVNKTFEELPKDGGVI